MNLDYHEDAIAFMVDEYEKAVRHLANLHTSADLSFKVAQVLYISVLTEAVSNLRADLRRRNRRTRDREI